LTLEGDYTYARNYHDVAITKFTFEQSLTYEEKQWSLTLAHSNGGDALQANGTDYNIQVFDENRSTVYARLKFVY
jgi:hypothetical protein